MKKRLRFMNRGSAIPLAAIAIIILLAMGVGLLSLGVGSRVYALRNASSITARCAADAGLTIALFEMNEKLQDQPWNAGVTLNGDVIVGLGSDPDTVVKDQGATVTGDRYGGKPDDELPQITTPTAQNVRT